MNATDLGGGDVHGRGAMAWPAGFVRGGHFREARVDIIAQVFATEDEGVPIAAQ